MSGMPSVLPLHNDNPNSSHGHDLNVTNQPLARDTDRPYSAPAAPDVCGDQPHGKLDNHITEFQNATSTEYGHHLDLDGNTTSNHSGLIDLAQDLSVDGSAWVDQVFGSQDPWPDVLSPLGLASFEPGIPAIGFDPALGCMPAVPPPELLSFLPPASSLPEPASTSLEPTSAQSYGFDAAPGCAQLILQSGLAPFQPPSLDQMGSSGLLAPAAGLQSATPGFGYNPAICWTYSLSPPEPLAFSSPTSSGYISASPPPFLSPASSDSSTASDASNGYPPLFPNLGKGIVLPAPSPLLGSAPDGEALEPKDSNDEGLKDMDKERPRTKEESLTLKAKIDRFVDSLVVRRKRRGSGPSLVKLKCAWCDKQDRRPSELKEHMYAHCGLT
ncbi:hypothetical protein FRC07_002058, partial [Ceratobasidium sp. 392]